MYASLPYATRPYIGGQPPPVQLAARPGYPYSLEMYSAAGAFLGPIPLAHDGTWTEELDRPATLTFSTPAAADWASNLEWPGLVKLRDQYGHTRGLFKILAPQWERDNASLTKTLRCEDLLGQLSEELVPSYDATPAQAKTAKQIVQDLLALQLASVTVKYGRIDRHFSTAVRSLSIRGKSILGALQELQATMDTPGTIYVDEYRRLQWRVSRGWNRGQQIRVGKNLQNLRRTRDWSQYYNRVYAYGGSVDENSGFDLTDAGEANEYIQDLTYSSEIRPYYLRDSRVKSAADLLTLAQGVLNKLARPRDTYSGDVIDLEHAQGPTTFSRERIYIGSLVRLCDEDLGINTRVYITKVTRSLDNPLQVSVELANTTYERGKTVADVIAELAERLLDVEQLPLFDATLPVTIADGAGAVGTSPFAAKRDHAHPYMTPTMPLSNDTPHAVQTTAAAGTASGASRSDHDHNPWQYGARIFSATDRAGLDTLSVSGVTLKNGDFATTSSPAAVYRYTGSVWRIVGAHIVTNASALGNLTGMLEGDLAFVQDTDRMFYYTGASWRIVGSYIVADAAACDALTGMQEGDFLLQQDTDQLFRYTGSAWRIVGPWRGTSAPTDTRIADGDAFHNTSTHKASWRSNGAWKLFTNYA